MVNTPNPTPVDPETMPKDTPSAESYKASANQFVWGWTPQAERWNGRLAMLGFVISILVEIATGHSVLGQIVS